VTKGSTSVTVAVIDIDYNHPDHIRTSGLTRTKFPPPFGRLTDVNGDLLITFYDLNDP
jgi:hypothetical protein